MDLNWGNFLYDEVKGIINFIDFGVVWEYFRCFVDNYLKMVGIENFLLFF